MANIFTQFGTAFIQGVKAFQRAFMGKSDAPEFESYDARLLRYAILWAMYENTAYQDVHNFARQYKSAYGLYRYARGIYNPVLRLGDFWRAHLLAGKLDPDAGDGSAIPSALPVVTENESLRPAIAQVWKWSNMQRLKGVLSLRTSIMGDGVLMVHDDPNKQKVSIRWLNPMFLKDVTFDGEGNVRGYVIEFKTNDPAGSNRTVKYTEQASRNGEFVVYQTFLNDNLYAWDGVSAEWDVEYGFVPMVVFQHNNVGLRWGWSELQPGLAKFREVDDIASKTSDYIRKVVDAPMLYAGVKDPSASDKGTPVRTRNRSTDKPDAGREEIPAIYTTNENAKAIPIIANLNLADTVTHLENMLAGLERDYPELATDLHNVEGEISGRALRINRNPAEEKVFDRRVDYDDAIVRIQKMAISIGGWRGYEGFQGFNLESFKLGDLEHTIGERPVFAKDPMDDLERDGVFWDTANKAKAAGVPLPVFLQQQGWDEKKINDVIKSEEYQMRLESQRLGVEGAKVAIQNPPQRQPTRPVRGSDNGKTVGSEK
jgi:hypothetical protein